MKQYSDLKGPLVKGFTKLLAGPEKFMPFNYRKNVTFLNLFKHYSSFIETNVE